VALPGTLTGRFAASGKLMSVLEIWTCSTEQTLFRGKPIAALAPYELASLDLPSTHSDGYEPGI
jgi:hypothetical protein